MMYRRLIITLLVLLLCPTLKGDDHNQLRCEYTHSTSTNKPNTDTKRSEWFSRFRLPFEDKKLAPKFCDKIDVSFKAGPIYYVECSAEAEMVRTEYELILDRKTGAITTLMDIRHHDETYLKMIHVGNCQLSEPSPSVSRDFLAFTPVRFESATLTDLPTPVKDFQQEAARWVTPEAANDSSEDAGAWLMQHLATPVKSYSEMAEQSGFSEERPETTIESVLLGPLIECPDCGGEVTEYCTATIDTVIEQAKPVFDSMVKRFKQHIPETIEDGDLDLRYRSFGLIGDHLVYERANHKSDVVAIVSNELVVSQDNLPPTHPDRDPQRASTSPWSGWHKVRASNGAIGFVKPDRANVLISSFEPVACVGLEAEKVMITRIGEAR